MNTKFAAKVHEKKRNVSAKKREIIVKTNMKKRDD